MVKYRRGDDAKMLPRSEYLDYYGQKIYFRFENRKNGRSISMSFYDTWTDPAKAKKLFERIYTVPKDIQNENGEMIARSLAPKMFRAAFPALKVKKTNQEQLHFRKACFPHMPMAVLAVCDTESFISIRSMSKSYADELRQGMKWAVEHYGHYLLSDLKPDVMAQDLLSLSDRKANSVIRSLYHLVMYENVWGFKLANPWESFLQISRNNRVPKKSSNRKKSEIICLSEREFTRILSRVLNLLQTTADTRLFAFLLYLTTPLSIEEICVLRFGDFKLLKEYSDCLIVEVNKELLRKKGAKNHCLHPINNPFRNRTYPLPSLVRQAFSLIEKPDEKQLLIHHPQNIGRYFVPAQYRKYICEEIIGYGDGIHEVSATISNNNSKLEEIIKETVRINLLTCGIETDELSYLFGNKPKSTSGYFYCDFGAEGELNRLTLLQDRWIGEYDQYVIGCHNPAAYAGADSKREEYTFTEPGELLRLQAQPGMLLNASVRLNIAIETPHKDTDEFISFLIRSSRGINTTIEMEEADG